MKTDFNSIISIVSTENVDISIKDNIMVGVYKTPNVTLQLAKDIIHTRVIASNNISYPLLADIRLVKSFDKEARDYIATEGTQLVTATAILTNSAITKTLANFYMKISKPLVPTRVFTNENEAFTWLQQYKS